MPYDLELLKRHGENVLISDLVSIVRPQLVELGNHVAIDPWLHLTTALVTGNHIHISARATIYGGKAGLLQMGHFTNLSAGATVICGSDQFKGDGLIAAAGIPDEFRDTLTIEPVIMEDFVNTGAGVTLFPGVHIPQGVVLGAGTTVRSSKELEPWSIYVETNGRLRKTGDRPSEKMLANARELGYPFQ